MRIAVCHEDGLVLDAVKLAALRQGKICHVCSNSADLLRDIRKETFDLIIVGSGTSDSDGLNVLQSVRNMKGWQIPVLFLTRGREEKRILAALITGADDCMAPPFRMGELMARVDALLRRAWPGLHESNGVFGRYQFKLDARSVSMDGTEVALRGREYDLALFLFRNAGRVLSRAHLCEVLSGQIPLGPSRSIDTSMSRLRTKLHLTAFNGYVLTAIYGLGYRLDPVNTTGHLKR